MAAIFIIVLVVLPLITDGKTPTVTLDELIHNQRFILFFTFLFAYALVYPLIAFVKLKRHLNGTFTDNREVIEKVFEALQYIKTEEKEGKIVYRRKSQFARFSQWYEDSVILETSENPVIISGMRKAVTRIDKMIDHFLFRSSE